MISVTKEVTFDCAHLLSGHEGLCKNLHGHTYKLQITISKDVSTNSDILIPEGPAEGMVIDFKDLNVIIKKAVVDVFDHAFVYWVDGGMAELAIAAVIKANDMRYVAMEDRPTAENMSKLIKSWLTYQFSPSDLIIRSVKLWETPNSFAEAT